MFSDKNKFKKYKTVLIKRNYLESSLAVMFEENQFIWLVARVSVF